MQRKSWRIRFVPLVVGMSVAACGVVNQSNADQPEGSTQAEADRTAMAVEALSRLQGVDLNQNPKLKETVLKVLEKTRGTPGFVKLVQQFKIAGQEAGLLEMAVQNPAREAGVQAMRLLLANNNFVVQALLTGTNVAAATKAAEALGNTREKEAVQYLLPLIADGKRDVDLRKQAVRSLAQTSDGAAALLRLAKEEKLADDLRFTASSELSRAHWPEIKAQAAMLLPLPQAQNAQPLPPLAELIRMKGDPVAGAKVFSSPTVACSTCHQVNGQGVEFGPNLSEIGSKLGKDALYEAILDPSAGIAFGFEGWQLQLKSGDDAYGMIVSETADELAMKTTGGIITRYKKGEITKREQMKVSIMPAGLQQAMTTQELVDLVEFLASLKKSP